MVSKLARIESIEIAENSTVFIKIY